MKSNGFHLVNEHDTHTLIQQEVPKKCKSRRTSTAWCCLTHDVKTAAPVWSHAVWPKEPDMSFSERRRFFTLSEEDNMIAIFNTCSARIHRGRKEF